jgi:hypothetical protein
MDSSASVLPSSDQGSQSPSVNPPSNPGKTDSPKSAQGQPVLRADLLGETESVAPVKVAPAPPEMDQKLTIVLIGMSLISPVGWVLFCAFYTTRPKTGRICGIAGTVSAVVYLIAGLTRV